MEPNREGLCYDECDEGNVEGIYENGVFRPVKNHEHRRVTLTVTAEEGISSLADCVNRVSPEDAREMLESSNGNLRASISPGEVA